MPVVLSKAFQKKGLEHYSRVNVFDTLRMIGLNRKEVLRWGLALVRGIGILNSMAIAEKQKYGSIWMEKK